VEAHQAVQGASVQVLMRNHLGVPFSTLRTERQSPALVLSSGELLTVDFLLTVPEIYSAHYSLTPSLMERIDNGDTVVCDWVDNAISFDVASGKLPIYGFVHVPCRVRASAIPRVTSPPR
jgi:Wzt C-terminal domain